MDLKNLNITKKKDKVGTVFDRFYFPKRPNYESVAEYFASLASEPQRILGIINKGDNIERNAEITNNLMRQELAKTTKRLDKKRKEFNEKRKKVNEQWDDLQDKENKLRQNFVRFNQFVKENQEKKERAANKITEHLQLKEERQRKANELRRKCQDIGRLKWKMDKKIVQYQIYEEFLLRVIENDESMKSVNDLLSRYEALVGARVELQEKQQTDMMKLEKAKSNLKKTTDNYLIQISSLYNQMNTLHERYKKAQLECKKWNKIQKYSVLEATEKVINTVAIKESCLKMNLEICQRKKIKPIHQNNVEMQLLTIKQAIKEYQIINRRVQEMKERDLRASIEPKVSSMT